MIEICSIEDCTACQACFNACRNNAISFEPDSIGNLYPIINQVNCINCGICKKVCPVNNPPQLYSCKKSYVGCANDENEQKTSTSGGIAAAISRFVVRKGGVVYGCTAIDPFFIHHIRVDHEHSLQKIKGSKYVQSRIDNIYTQVLFDLKEKKTVFFVGTPCQIAGLKGFLRHEYDNLFTADFVCHGVASQKLFSESLKLSFKNQNIGQDCYIHFRFKNAKGNTNYGMFVQDKKGNTLLKEKYPENDYILGFLKGIFYRSNCYSCKYACPERVADITLGDYRDDEKMFTMIPHYKLGLSKVLVNTHKGEYLLNECSCELVLKPISIEQIILTGGQLIHPMPKHKESDRFIRLYQAYGISIAFKEILPLIKSKARRTLRIRRFINFIYSFPLVKQIIYFFRKK